MYLDVSRFYLVFYSFQIKIHLEGRFERIALNHLVGMLAEVAMPFTGRPTCCVLGSHLFPAVDDHDFTQSSTSMKIG